MKLPALRSILDLPAFRGAELISGSSQLDRPVTWVHVAEVLDVWRFLTGGEFVLSTGLELARASNTAQCNYIRALAQADVRALGLELVQWMDEVPVEVQQTANSINFPIVGFRSEVSFAHLTRAAQERILRPHLERKDEPALDSLLDALIETGRDKVFLQRQLGPVLLLPPRPRATLLATLEALLEAQFNIAEAARRLGLRRQSIYYRLDQLNGLLGSLNDEKQRVGFLIALALLRRNTPQE